MLFAIIYVEMSHLAQTIHNCLYVNDLELHTHVYLVLYVRLAGMGGLTVCLS